MLELLMELLIEMEMRGLFFAVLVVGTAKEATNQVWQGEDF